VTDGLLQPVRDEDAELAVLGACMLTGRAVEPLRSEVGLTPEHFTTETRRRVFAAMCDLDSEGVQPDTITLRDRLSRAGAPEPADGWAARLDRLAGYVPSAANVLAYGARVVDAWRQERRRRAGLEQARAAAVGDDDAWRSAYTDAEDVPTVGTDRDPVTREQIAEHMIDWANSDPEPGLPMPWPRLADALRLAAGHCTIWSGWSHIGKSHCVDQVAAEVGRAGGRAVVWINEGVLEERYARQITRDTGVPYERLVRRTLRPDDWPKVLAASQDLPFSIVRAHGRPAEEIARHIRRVKPDLAIVDHFHQLPGVSKTADADQAIQALVAAAGQSMSHVIVVCQLNQERVKSSVKPPPVARDLRNSGSLYFAPENVVFVHRTHRRIRDDDGAMLEEDRAEILDEGHIEVAKQRGGRFDLVPVTFDPYRLRFVESS
jgi:replicative DNA helicase